MNNKEGLDEELKPEKIQRLLTRRQLLLRLYSSVFLVATLVGSLKEKTNDVVKMSMPTSKEQIFGIYALNNIPEERLAKNLYIKEGGAEVRNRPTTLQTPGTLILTRLETGTYIPTALGYIGTDPKDSTIAAQWAIIKLKNFSPEGLAGFVLAERLSVDPPTLIT